MTEKYLTDYIRVDKRRVKWVLHDRLIRDHGSPPSLVRLGRGGNHNQRKGIERILGKTRGAIFKNIRSGKITGMRRIKRNGVAGVAESNLMASAGLGYEPVWREYNTFIGIDSVAVIFSTSRRTIEDWIEKGTFPKAGSFGWVLGEVIEFLHTGEFTPKGAKPPLPASNANPAPSGGRDGGYGDGNGAAGDDGDRVFGEADIFLWVREASAMDASIPDFSTAPSTLGLFREFVIDPKMMALNPDPQESKFTRSELLELAEFLAIKVESGDPDFRTGNDIIGVIVDYITLEYLVSNKSKPTPDVEFHCGNHSQGNGEFYDDKSSA